MTMRSSLTAAAALWISVACLLAASASAAPATRPVKAPAKTPAKTPVKPSIKAPAPLPAQDEIEKTFDAKDYPQTLQMLGRVLPLKGDEAAGYDRHELLMLKAETHLRMRQIKLAGDTFAAAAKATDEPQQAALARAMQRVLREAKGTTVSRKLAKTSEDVPASADITDPERREDVFRIVYAEANAAAQPKVKEALRARSLPPIADAIKLLSELDDLAAAANLSDAEHASARRDLGVRAEKLIDKELVRMKKDVEAIHESANTVARQVDRVPYASGGYRDEYGTHLPDETTITTDIIYRGLSEQDRRDLRAVIATCERIIPTAEALAQVTDGNVKAADDRIDNAKDLARAASRVLGARYSSRQEQQTLQPRGGRR